jgi:hypothetical protein
MRNVVLPVGELAEVLRWTRRKHASILVIEDRTYIVRPGHDPLLERLDVDPQPTPGVWHRVVLDRPAEI